MTDLRMWGKVATLCGLLFVVAQFARQDPRGARHVWLALLGDIARALLVLGVWVGATLVVARWLRDEWGIAPMRSLVVSAGLGYTLLVGSGSSWFWMQGQTQWLVDVLGRRATLVAFVALGLGAVLFGLFGAADFFGPEH
jgi:hypothetical protein